jgi:hypothetical protein
MDPPQAFSEILVRLHRPYRPVPVLELLLGVSRRTAREMAGVALATSAEADLLVRTMPRALRSLEVTSSARTERCSDGLRGPVLWSETMSARAASAGDPGTFVCSSSVKAYDNDANRVLVAALAAVVAAGSVSLPHRARHSPVVREARQRARRAQRYLDHRTLADVSRAELSPRALRMTRTSRRRRSYQPALALLGRSGGLLAPAPLAAAADRRSAEGAVLLARCLIVADASAVRSGRAPQPVRCDPDQLVAGPLAYRRARRAAPRITIGGADVRMDTPEEVLLASLAAATPAGRDPG